MRLALACLVVVGCATDHSRSQCEGLGCASLPGTLTLTVTESLSHQPVFGQLMFTSMGQPLPFTCSDPANPSTCPSWRLSEEGAFDVDVKAPGYLPGTVHVVIEGPAGCCGTGPDTSATLELVPMI